MLKSIKVNIFLALVLTILTTYLLSDASSPLNAGAIGLIAIFWYGLTSLIRRKHEKDDS